VPEGGGVKVPQFRDRELGRCKREADVRVRELRAQALTARERDLAVIERQLGQRRDRMPGRIRGEPRINAGGYEAEVRRRDLPFAGIAIGVAERLELLEVEVRRR